MVSASCSSEFLFLRNIDLFVRVPLFILDSLTRNSLLFDTVYEIAQYIVSRVSCVSLTLFARVMCVFIVDESQCAALCEEQSRWRDESRSRIHNRAND